MALADKRAGPCWPRWTDSISWLQITAFYRWYSRANGPRSGTAFTVQSASEITTTVPAGATTGKVEVTLPVGTLSSNVPFRVP
jgi:hypothetical protein